MGKSVIDADALLEKMKRERQERAGWVENITPNQLGIEEQNLCKLGVECFCMKCRKWHLRPKCE